MSTDDIPWESSGLGWNEPFHYALHELALVVDLEAQVLAGHPGAAGPEVLRDAHPLHLSPCLDEVALSVAGIASEFMPSAFVIVAHALSLTERQRVRPVVCGPGCVGPLQVPELVRLVRLVQANAPPFCVGFHLEKQSLVLFGWTTGPEAESAGGRLIILVHPPLDHPGPPWTQQGYMAPGLGLFGLCDTSRPQPLMHLGPDLGALPGSRWALLGRHPAPQPSPSQVLRQAEPVALSCLGHLLELCWPHVQLDQLGALEPCA